MKLNRSWKKFALVMLFALGTVLPASAGCLAAYDQDLYSCDNSHCGSYSPFECSGCYADAVGKYWGCVGHNILN